MQSFWERNRVWVVIFGLGFVGAAIIAQFDMALALKFSAYAGLIALAATLLPSNLAKLNLHPFLNALVRPLVPHKRAMGISAGLFFCIHALLSTVYFNPSLDIWFYLSRPILFGVIAISIFIALLLTSSEWVQQKLGRSWKTLHSLVWFAMPIAFFHVFVAGWEFEAEFSKLSFASFGVFTVFSFFEVALYKLKKQPNPFLWKHLKLVVAGLIVGLILLFLNHNPVP